MKSLQICLLSALLVICASSPIPQELSSTPAVPVDVTPAVKSAVPAQTVVPGVAVTEVPLQKSLDNEKIPEPQALPSKKEEAAPAKAEEKKREAPPAPAAADATPATLEAGKTPELPVPQPQKDVQQPEQVTGKSLPEPTKPAAPEASTPKAAEPIAAGSAKSEATEQPTPKAAEPAPTVPGAAASPEVKATDAKQAVESTVVPVVPAAIASEKKIDAGLYSQFLL